MKILKYFDELKEEIRPEWHRSNCFQSCLKSKSCFRCGYFRRECSFVLWRTVEEKSRTIDSGDMKEQKLKLESDDSCPIPKLLLLPLNLVKPFKMRLSSFVLA